MLSANKILFDNSFINVHAFVISFTLNLIFYKYSSKLHFEKNMYILIKFISSEIITKEKKHCFENLLG